MTQGESTPSSLDSMDHALQNPAYIPPIYRLPPELLFEISEYLALYDSVRLGISSRHLYHKVDPNIWVRARSTRDQGGTKDAAVPVAQHELQERWEFLRSLEPYLDNHELCHFCRVFHPRKPGQEHTLQRKPPTPGVSGPECNFKEVSFQRWGTDWGFGFRDIYAVLNRHRYGGQHGLPSSELCISTDWSLTRAYKNLYNASRSPFKRFMCYTKLDAEAHILKDQLLVHRIQRLWLPIHTQGTDVLIRYGAGDIASDFKICSHHSQLSGEMIHNFTIPLRDGLKVVLAADAVLGESAQPSNRLLPRLIKRCEECPTEYEITFHKHANASVEIILDVWQNFGCVREPQDPGWANCWGQLNPRFAGTPLVDNWRTRWFESDVAYVNGNRATFPTWGGRSGTSHPSAEAVRVELARMHAEAEDPSDDVWQPRKRIKTPIQDHMSRYQYDSLIRKVLNARYVARLTNINRNLPPFPAHLDGVDGKVMVAYTRQELPGELIRVAPSDGSMCPPDVMDTAMTRGDVDAQGPEEGNGGT